MTFRLAPTALQAGYRLESLEAAGSTNAIALERAGSGDAGGLWVVTDRQEAGRGRRGRPWQTEKGNLAASLLVVGDHDLKRTATLGFVAGLSLHDALSAIVPSANVAVALDAGRSAGGSARNRFELKWPNDVLAAGAKLSGILLESTLRQDGKQATAIGWGVNVVSHPSDTPYPASSLLQLGASCDASDVFTALSDAWQENYSVWNGPAGLDHIRLRWLDRASGIGSSVAVNLDGRVARGIFETIDEDCRFVIRQDDGTRMHIAAGDVHFGAVSSARN
ncbi:biotin--[acetyl-CoA-carboxylase] ligase [Pararhizobium haloflavum]|uniref:biotin--[acetyl-CoA-carboxylase] ligase n=1 Tax=Pararhizobium haloflavum TaxID=2037914 RepID=UPI000C19C49F|nr:biotin--[acetyl-CoA-carboxylase] ligase [Pararhizobium haloflavum]